MTAPEQTSDHAAPWADAFIERFETAWRDGGEPQIAQMLELAAARIVSDDRRRNLLHELICIDLEYRWKRPAPVSAGPSTLVARPTLDDYIAVHPELGQVRNLPIELITEEYRVRRRWGDKPDHVEFIYRFGNRGGEIAAALQRVDVELQKEFEPSDAPDLPLAARIKRPRRVAEYDERAPLNYRDFVLQLHVGSGGIGKVYRARQRSLQRTVAVKMLRRPWLQFPAAVEQFLQEARTVASLRHPHIVGVHGLGRTPRGGYFLVMDWVDGQNLAEVLAARPVRFEDAVDWVAQAADALAYAHSMGVIHCDLKPSNLLLDCTGKIFVTDFGFALPLENARGSHCIGGTLGYLAPERIAGDAHALAPAIDVYGLGAVLYTLLTGRRPFADAPRWDAKPVSPRTLHPDLPLALEAVCLRCLAADPRQRFNSATELATAIRRAVKDCP